MVFHVLPGILLIRALYLTMPSVSVENMTKKQLYGIVFILHIFLCHVSSTRDGSRGKAAAAEAAKENAAQTGQQGQQDDEQEQQRRHEQEQRQDHQQEYALRQELEGGRSPAPSSKGPPHEGEKSEPVLVLS